MEKPRKLTTRQYLGLVCDLNLKMAQMPPLFNDNQHLDEYELLNSLANKDPRSHKAMIIPQGFNPETGDLVTFVEHCKRDETMDNIAIAKFSASDEDSDTKKNKSVLRRLRSVRTTVRNVVRTPHFIVASTEKKMVTPQGSENSSKQGLKIKTSLSMIRRITRGSSRNLISCRQKLPTKNPNMKS